MIQKTIDRSYERLLEQVLQEGQYRPDRTGTGAYSAFGKSLNYDLTNGFPLITTKHVHYKSVLGELLWFVSGSSNKFELEQKYGATIWREWGDNQTGDLGPVYGHQWRQGTWVTDDGELVMIDQLASVIANLKNDPFGRRHIVNSWNVGQLGDMALPPCHMMFQFFVGSDHDGKPTDLNLHLYQRSADLFLGVPYNIASYATLLEMVGQQVGLPTKQLKLTFGDAHIYSNHRDQIVEQIGREPYTFPTLTIDPAPHIDAYNPDMFHLSDYQHHRKIVAPVAV